MTEALIGVAEGDYTFDFPALVDDVRAHWPEARWFPAESFMPPTHFGTIQIPRSDGHVAVDVGLQSAGKGIGLDGYHEDVAEFVAWLTQRPGFPGDGSVVIINWAADLLALEPGTTTDSLLAAAE
ncbi:hypothetical protein ICW40_05695 [Actinotalea ferrariae]|uniref:hypothetical protein n=1 Tax=Actinotalea ferrariae TaxID=1386098 RepID=UPI001C8BB567|nr:hypothetical protein [Actinotalea ferrariae]MBX9244299.1 hypothetical protein [Actinotalea ferrariae]